MPEVLEIEQNEVEENQINQPKWDSWTVEIPPEIIEAQGLAEGSLATFTINDGEIEGTIITPSPKSKESAKRFIEKYRDFMIEATKNGD